MGLLDELKAAAASAFGSLDERNRGQVDEISELLTGNLERIVEYGKRADNIVKSMLAHSRAGGGDRQIVDLNALVEESLNSLITAPAPRIRTLTSLWIGNMAPTSRRSNSCRRTLRGYFSTCLATDSTPRTSAGVR